MIENYSLCLNEFRKNLAALGNCSLRCSTTGTPDRRNAARTIPVGDQSTFAVRDVGARAMQEQLAAFAIFPLIFVPFMQHSG